MKDFWQTFVDVLLWRADWTFSAALWAILAYVVVVLIVFFHA